jgi:hypothetical protein
MSKYIELGRFYLIITRTAVPTGLYNHRYFDVIWKNPKHEHILWQIATPWFFVGCSR